MAVSETNAPKKGEGAPAWVVPLYVGGLALLYVGERVISTFDSGRWLISGLGLSCVLAATAVRFIPTWQAGGERGRIERLLGILSLVGLAGVLLYFLGTDGGLDKIGFAQSGDDARAQAKEVLTVAWVTLVFVSVLPTLFAEAALYPMRNAERLESRRVKAAAGSGLVLALAGVYGSLFVYAADGADWKADFSYFKTAEPSESTRKLVQGLGQKVKIIAFFPEVSPVRREVEGYLKALAQGVPTLEVAVYDRYLEPKIASEMKVVQDGTIVIVKGEAKRTVFIGTELKDAQKKLKTLDRDFQERLFKLLRERRTVYLTVGHGELNDDDRGADASAEGRTSQILKELLSKQHYTTKTLGLSQGLGTDVPDDADIVMVLGPTQPLSPEELASLKRYADRGGKLFIALDPDAIAVRDFASATAEPAASGVQAVSAEKKAAAPAPAASAAPSAAPAASSGAPAGEAAEAAPPAPASPDSTLGGLQALAAVAGLTFDPNILANDKQYVRRRYNDSDRTLLVTNRFSSHAAVSTLSRNSSRAAVLVAGSGSLEKAKNASVKADTAIRAMATTFADANRNYQFDSAEKRESFGVAMAVSEPAKNAPAPKKEEEPKKPESPGNAEIPEIAPPIEMRAFVLADADALTDIIMSNFMTNQLLFVDAVRWLGGEESFAGEVNNEEDVRIEHTQQKDLVWFYTTIFGVPALVLGLGLTYSRRARRPRGGKK